MDGMETMRRRIARWRRTQPAYARMPDELWAAAVALARVDGAYAVARDLGVNYGALKRRVDRSAAPRAERSAPRFVELNGAEVFGAREPADSVVELSGADGAKLTVRLRNGEPLDVVALAGAFLRRGA
jgi:hypothetical protein